jgi:protocadherin Fat 1/2/3
MSILTVTANDADTGHNAKIHYHLEPSEKGNSDHNYFHIDPEKGIILTKMKLNREVTSLLKFHVVATDSGFPALSTSVSVTIVITDLNDNPPKFEQPSYDVTITDLAQRGQFVTKVIASDPDSSDADQLAYSIVGGNVKQTFSIEERTGIIRLSSLRRPEFQSSYALNISVTDGVFTNFARVLIKVEFSNNHVPTFSQSLYDVDVVENAAAGAYVTKVKATDLDTGKYGDITYSIESEDAEELFRIESDSGKIFMSASQ